MPLPLPRKRERQSNFMSRCMGDPVMNKDFPKQDQRAAVCIKQWNRGKKVKAVLEALKNKTTG